MLKSIITVFIVAAISVCAAITIAEARTCTTTCTTNCW